MRTISLLAHPVRRNTYPDGGLRMSLEVERRHDAEVVEATLRDVVSEPKHRISLRSNVTSPSAPRTGLSFPSQWRSLRCL